MRALLVLALLALLALAGCLSPDAPAAITKTKVPPCGHYDDGRPYIFDDGYYLLSANGEVWQETNGIRDLQMHRTCEGQPDTRIH